MPKASEIKRGSVVELDGQPYIAKQIEVKSPSARGAATLYKIRFNNLQNGQKRDESLKGDDFLKEADCERKAVQFSYLDGETYMFMDMQDYSQYGLNADELDGLKDYLYEGLEDIVALLVDGDIKTVELPQSVTLEITETSPGIKGASASARTKPAMLSTGLEVQVPEYLDAGERVKVNTSTGKYMSRA
jgi:elongation factor P